MNEVKWVVENTNLEKKMWDDISTYLETKNREVFRPKYIPFSSEKLESPFADDDCVVVFGCLGLVRNINLYNKWTPGVWCDWKKLECSNYLNYYYKHSVHYNWGLYPLGFVRNNINYIHSRYALGDEVFIRPDNNFKSFNAELVDLENHWERFWSNVDCYNTDPCCLVMVSSPREIEEEWRLIISEGKVVTGGQYRDKTGPSIKPGFDPKAVELAEELCKIWTPHDIFTMDICKVQTDQYKLVEIGSVNGAGLYDCDIEKIVDAVEKIAIKDWKDSYEL